EPSGPFQQLLGLLPELLLLPEVGVGDGAAVVGRVGEQTHGGGLRQGTAQSCKDDGRRTHTSARETSQSQNGKAAAAKPASAVTNRPVPQPAARGGVPGGEIKTKKSANCVPRRAVRSGGSPTRRAARYLRRAPFLPAGETSSGPPVMRRTASSSPSGS